MRYTTKELSTIILFSAIGAILSVPIGYIADYLKVVPFLPMGVGQILAGMHLIMIALITLRLKKPGVATITGAIKGLTEAILFSFHGLPVIAMSGIQGAIIDIVSSILGYTKLSSALGCGLSAISNVFFLQFFLLLPLPQIIFTLMYLLSFASGILLGAYPAQKLDQMIKARI